ncbi:MAG: hypothetical protein ACXWQR_19410 [Ktedonobacterales bacterium]
MMRRYWAGQVSPPPSPRRKGQYSRRIAASGVSLLFIVGLMLSVTFAHTAQAAGAVAADTAGSVSGVLVNGTHGNAVVPHQGVTLQAVVRGKAQDVATTTSDGAGHFSFSGLDTTGETTYAVYSMFQGGTFPSAAITFDTGNTQQVTLTVYDVTTSDAALRIGVANILINSQTESNKLKGTVPVGEFLTFVNSGNTAYVGSVTPANGKPMNLLRFSLPNGATNLALGAGFAGVQIVQVDTGFGAQATVPPGKSQFAFAYDVTYSGTDYTFQYKAEYPTDRVAVLAVPSVGVDARDFTADSSVAAGGVQYQALHRDAMKHDDLASFRLTRLPLPGEDPVIDVPHLAVVGTILALLLALALGLYLRRGDLAVALGLIPPAKRVSPARVAKVTLAERETERKRLLRALLALDARHDAGTLSDAEYQRRRDETRASLRVLLDDQTQQPRATKQQSVVQAATTKQYEQPQDIEAGQQSQALTGERR